MSDNLRFGETYRADPPADTYFDYSEDGGWDRAVEKCSGMAVCRKLDAGTMCPSFMVTLEEEHSTRGRANALREAMRGNLPGMKSTEVVEALDLCRPSTGPQHVEDRRSYPAPGLSLAFDLTLTVHARIDVYVPIETGEALDNIADRQPPRTGKTKTRADIVREALEAYVRKHLPDAGR
jgi:hypothetical protein